MSNLELKPYVERVSFSLFQSLAKLQEEKASKASNLTQVENKITRSSIAKLISEIQVKNTDLISDQICFLFDLLYVCFQTLKQCLSELFAVYVSFAAELEEKSKQLQENVEQQRYYSLKECGQDTVESKSRNT